jgi:hypothetical protein
MGTLDMIKIAAEELQARASDDTFGKPLEALKRCVIDSQGGLLDKYLAGIGLKHV